MLTFYSASLQTKLEQFDQKINQQLSIHQLAELSRENLLFFHTELDLWKSQNSPNICQSKCSHCCNHWVDGLDSFEALAIYSKLRKLPDFTDLLTEFFEREVMFEQHSIKNSDYEQALHLYFNSNYRCPSLSVNNTCSIYSFRPIICSLYQAIQSSDSCKPQTITQHPKNNQIIEIHIKHQKTLAQIDVKLSNFNIPESYFQAMLHLFENEQQWQKNTTTFLYNKTISY